MEKKGNVVLIILLSLLVLILGGYIVYDKFFNKIDVPVENNEVESIVDSTNQNNENNNNSTTFDISNIYNDIIGKYINKNDNEEYIIFNVDKTATIKYATGGGPAQLIENIAYEITYDENNNIFINLIYDEIPSPICKKYLVKIDNGEYILDVTTPTPASTPGDYSFIKE